LAAWLSEKISLQRKGSILNIDTAAARRYLGIAPRMPKRFFQRVLSTWDGRSRRIEEAGEAARVWQRAQSVVGKIELLELGELASGTALTSRLVHRAERKETILREPVALSRCRERSWPRPGIVSGSYSG